MARLAVIGAGPKGAAIAAKAAALSAANYHEPPPHIDLYDHAGVGAAWRGLSGYTDGVQPLCTLAERDLGFPYDTATYGPEVAQTMVGEFSWQSFAVNAAGTSRYRDWVVNGRHPPRHDEFARYLQYAVGKAVDQGAATLIDASVSLIDFNEYTKKWRIESLNSTGMTTAEDYDGVVITGSGRPLEALKGANARVFDGCTFWSSTAEVLRLLSVDPDFSVVIIGAGGTAAAIAYWFLRAGFEWVPITIIGREATLFARHHAPFEDRLFTAEEEWDRLPAHVRKAFLDRTTAAVVWDNVLQNLVSDNITYECYNALRYHTVGGPSVGGPGEPAELALEMEVPRDPALAVKAESGLPGWLRTWLSSFAPPPPPLFRRPGTVIIDARGFDRWGFAQEYFATTSPLRAFFADPDRYRQILWDVASDLSVCGRLADGGQFPPRLHVPGLGSMRGPASTNLMALGWLADRILSTYCQQGGVQV